MTPAERILWLNNAQDFHDQIKEVARCVAEIYKIPLMPPAAASAFANKVIELALQTIEDSQNGDGEQPTEGEEDE